jgi:hypothetical protein
MAPFGAIGDPWHLLSSAPVVVKAVRRRLSRIAFTQDGWDDATFVFFARCAKKLLPPQSRSLLFAVVINGNLPGLKGAGPLVTTVSHFRNARTTILVVLSLLAFQQSCGTHTASHVPVPDGASPPVEAESAGLEAVAPEWAESKQETSKLPEELVEAPQPVLPESVLTRPEKDLRPPVLRYDTVLLARALEPPLDPGWQYRADQESKIVGFEFSNHGGNRILPRRYNIDKREFYTRDFQFRFDDRARQDIHLSVSDWAPSRDREFRLSELMNTVMHFFPRTFLPAIARADGRVIVTLPTGETVEFDDRTHEVLGGVLVESPVDLNPDKTARRFPAVSYVGKGVIVRADSRGRDPRLGTMATITTGLPAADCQGSACSQCRVPSKELWEQTGANRFRFPSDMEFDRYLLSRCGFGLPKSGGQFMIASSQAAAWIQISPAGS